MIDPITEYILESMSHIESVKFQHKMESEFRYARGFPGGKQNEALYRKKKADCRKKEDQLDKQGKSREAHIYDLKCGTAALCELDNVAINLVRKYGPSFCSKYNDEEKKICMETMKLEIKNLKYECDSNKRSMKIELRGR